MIGEDMYGVWSGGCQAMR